jgi:hypothetical protein
MQATFLIALAAALNLPQPVPPVTEGLANGYYLTPHGCIASVSDEGPFAAANFRRRRATQLGYDDPTVLESKLRAAQHENHTEHDVDLGIRLPLSIALYRKHRVPEAMAQWRILLRHERTDADAGTRAALDGRFHDAFVAYALAPPGFNPITFRENGGAYNLQRGLNAAARDDLNGAVTFLGYAVECSYMFQVPHLALGVIAASHRDFTTARHEWLADLEGWDPAPPDTAGITGAQFDAVHLLLKFG